MAAVHQPADAPSVVVHLPTLVPAEAIPAVAVRLAAVRHPILAPAEASLAVAAPSADILEVSPAVAAAVPSEAVVTLAAEAVAVAADTSVADAKRNEQTTKKSQLTADFFLLNILLLSYNSNSLISPFSIRLTSFICLS